MNKNLLKILKAIADNDFTVESTFTKSDMKYQCTVFKSDGEDLFISTVSGINVPSGFAKDIIGYILHFDKDYVLQGCNWSQFDIDLSAMILNNYKVEYV